MDITGGSWDRKTYSLGSRRFSPSATSYQPAVPLPGTEQKAGRHDTTTNQGKNIKCCLYKNAPGLLVFLHHVLLPHQEQRETSRLSDACLCLGTSYNACLQIKVPLIWLNQLYCVPFFFSARLYLTHICSFVLKCVCVLISGSSLITPSLPSYKTSFSMNLQFVK